MFPDNRVVKQRSHAYVHSYREVGKLQILNKPGLAFLLVLPLYCMFEGEFALILLIIFNILDYLLHFPRLGRILSNDLLF